jgi:hypothetical protein
MGGSEPSSPFGRCGKDYAAPSKGAAAGRNRSLRMRAAGPLPPKTKRIPPFLDTDETHNRTHALLSHLRHSYLGYQDCTHPNPIIERRGASVPPTLLAGHALSLLPLSRQHRAIQPWAKLARLRDETVPKQCLHHVMARAMIGGVEHPRSRHSTITRSSTSSAIAPGRDTPTLLN